MYLHTKHTTAAARDSKRTTHPLQLSCTLATVSDTSPANSSVMEEGPWLKLVSHDMVNRKFQLKVGRNTVDDFEADEECGPGLYFCKPEHVLHWMDVLGYTHLCDVEVPAEATAAHFESKSKADMINIVSESVPIGEHWMWANEEICLAAVQQNGRALQYVQGQTPEMCMAAVQHNGYALPHVKEQTPEICLAAVQQEGHALYYVKEQTPKICLAAVQQCGYALKYVKEQTPKIWCSRRRRSAWPPCSRMGVRWSLCRGRRQRSAWPQCNRTATCLSTSRIRRQKFVSSVGARYAM
jgi:hypothetical protein